MRVTNYHGQVALRFLFSIIFISVLGLLRSGMKDQVFTIARLLICFISAVYYTAILM